MSLDAGNFRLWVSLAGGHHDPDRKKDVNTHRLRPERGVQEARLARGDSALAGI